MAASQHLTIGELSELFGLAEWQLRRAVDSLSPEVARAGQYRLVPRSRLGELAVELQRRGWLPSPEAATS